MATTRGKNEEKVLAGGLVVVAVEGMVGMAAVVMVEEEMEVDRMTTKMLMTMMGKLYLYLYRR